MTNVAQPENEELVSLETSRNVGVGVTTPIWFAEVDGVVLMWTGVNSGNVKGIRSNPPVTGAPCARMGETTGEWASARATIEESLGAVGHVEALRRRRVGLGFAVFRQVDTVRSRRRAGRRICVKVYFPEHG